MARKRPGKHCTAHRSSDGQPCEGWSVVGASVCSAHGGRAPQVQAAAKERLAADAAARLSLPVETTAADALQDGLARVNGQVIYLAERVAALSPEELTWGTTQRRIRTRQGPDGTADGPVVDVVQGERKHPLWAALDDAIARRSAIAAEMAKLGIEERRQAVFERDAAMIFALLERIFTDFRMAFSFTAAEQVEGRAIIARSLRAIADGG